jgi:hypothetical protein
MALPRTLDLDLLRGFETVARTGSFSRAASELLRNQSTISLQIQRLEDMLGQRLFIRSPRAVRLSAYGQTFLEDTRRLLALNDDVLGRATAPQLAGRVRLGTPEDFATIHLPAVLAGFAASHPAVLLEVTCDLTLNLLEQHRADPFDLVLIKREPQSRVGGGVRVWGEDLVWVGARPLLDQGTVLPLAVSPEPCVYRKRITNALTRSGRDYRIAYSCAALSGTLAAVRAGLGFTALPRGMVPRDLAMSQEGLPRLAPTEIALISAETLSAPARLLARQIVRALEVDP